MKITKLKFTKNGKRVSVFIDKEFAFSVEKALVIDFKLFAGKELDDKLTNRIKSKDFVLRYYKKVLELIVKRPRSEFEIRSYLKRKAFEKKIKDTSYIDRTILKLKDEEFLDDLKFAKWWIENRFKFKPRGVLLIKKELRARGVSKEKIEKAISESSITEGKILDMARSLGEKKYRLLDGIESGKDREKFLNFIIRKGFSYKTANKVLSELTVK